MNRADDNTSDLEELKIDRQLRSHGEGAMTQKIGRGPFDPRVSKLLGWVWAGLGTIALYIGQGIYQKLNNISDTLIVAVTNIKTQGDQIADLKAEVRELRTEQTALQRQVDSLQGTTLRGIQEAARAR